MGYKHGALEGPGSESHDPLPGQHRTDLCISLNLHLTPLRRGNEAQRDEATHPRSHSTPPRLTHSPSCPQSHLGPTCTCNVTTWLYLLSNYYRLAAEL